MTIPLSMLRPIEHAVRQYGKLGSWKLVQRRRKRAVVVGELDGRPIYLKMDSSPDRIRREVVILRACNRLLPHLRFPLVIATGYDDPFSDGTKSWALLTELAGTRPANVRHVLPEMITALPDLHSALQQAVAPEGSHHWFDGLTELLETHVLCPRPDDLFDKQIRQQVDEVVRRVRGEGVVGVATVIHGDLQLAHVRWDGSSLGFLDFGDVRHGEDLFDKAVVTLGQGIQADRLVKLVDAQNRSAMSRRILDYRLLRAALDLAWAHDYNLAAAPYAATLHEAAEEAR